MFNELEMQLLENEHWHDLKEGHKYLKILELYKKCDSA